LLQTVRNLELLDPVLRFRIETLCSLLLRYQERVPSDLAFAALDLIAGLNTFAVEEMIERTSHVGQVRQR